MIQFESTPIFFGPKILHIILKRNQLRIYDAKSTNSRCSRQLINFTGIKSLVTESRTLTFYKETLKIMNEKWSPAKI